jgi:hypothetical protein
MVRAGGTLGLEEKGEKVALEEKVGVKETELLPGI